MKQGRACNSEPGKDGTNSRQRFPFDNVPPQLEPAVQVVARCRRDCAVPISSLRLGEETSHYTWTGLFLPEISFSAVLRDDTGTKQWDVQYRPSLTDNGLLAAAVDSQHNLHI